MWLATSSCWGLSFIGTGGAGYGVGGMESRARRWGCDGRHFAGFNACWCVAGGAACGSNDGSMLPDTLEPKVVGPEGVVGAEICRLSPDLARVAFVAAGAVYVDDAC